jgi:hypothetical protein
MKLMSNLMVLAIVCAFGAMACSDDDNNTPTPDKGVQDQAVTDQSAGDQSAGDQSTSDTSGSTGKCDNTSDKAAIQKTWGTPAQDLSTIVAGQQACLLQTDPKKCILDNIRTATNGDVSDDCLGCYADSALCGAANCLAPCTANPPTPAACDSCRCGDNTAKVNCVAAFEACSGVSSTTTCK